MSIKYYGQKIEVVFIGLSCYNQHQNGFYAMRRKMALMI